MSQTNDHLHHEPTESHSGEPAWLLKELNSDLANGNHNNDLIKDLKKNHLEVDQTFVDKNYGDIKLKDANGHEFWIVGSRKTEAEHGVTFEKDGKIHFSNGTVIDEDGVVKDANGKVISDVSNPDSISSQAAEAAVKSSVAAHASQDLSDVTAAIMSGDFSNITPEKLAAIISGTQYQQRALGGTILDGATDTLDVAASKLNGKTTPDAGDGTGAAKPGDA